MVTVIGETPLTGYYVNGSPVVPWPWSCPVRLLPVLHWTGNQRAACEDWPRLHPLEGRQHMSKKLDKRAVRDLLNLGWSEEAIVALFIGTRARQIRRLIEREG